jgi:hypothetical protein
MDSVNVFFYSNYITITILDMGFDPCRRVIPSMSGATSIGLVLFGLI